MTHNEIKKTISKLTPGQQATLGLIAIDMGVAPPKSTLNILLKKGLIEARIITAPDCMAFKHYYMPFNVHMAWCEWCAAGGTIING